MKKKINVFALLLSFMLALIPPEPAAAEYISLDTQYKDVEDFMHKNGYHTFTKDSDDRYTYIVALSGDYLYVIKKRIFNFNPYFGFNGDCVILFHDSSSNQTGYIYKYYNPQLASLYDNYSILHDISTVYEILSSGNYIYQNKSSLTYWYISLNYNNNTTQILYSDFDIYYVNYDSDTEIYTRNFDNVYMKSNRYDYYSFPVWCQDSGLNCLASSNESPTKIPYSFNSYLHIVRRNAAGQWLLTTVGNSVMDENMEDYTLLELDNGNLGLWGLYAGEDVNGYLVNVRQYIYDTDGWKVRTYDTYDVREDDDCIIDFGAGSGFDDYRILAYTSSDIYSETGLDLVYAASTEYVDITDTPVVPDSPTPIPTTAPDSGSGGNNSSGAGRPGSGTRPDTGGQATGGGGLDFIINLFTLIWTKICSIPMAVDGYSISLQQIVIYGALVSIVGGFIMHFIFGRK